jgi:hypothetical protein
VTVANSSHTLRSSVKTAKRHNSHKYQQISKRIRVSSENIDENRTELLNNRHHQLSVHNDNELQVTSNVFDILNQTDQISSSTKTNTE